jgi:hypothetical protein
MVTLPRVEILISYAHDPASRCGGGGWYWLDVIPLRPGRRTLTCWIRKVWDATYRSSNLGKLVYEAGRGPLCTRPYRLFQQHDLLYLLPVRNVAWRSIRRVRIEAEEAQYHGFDATARSLINHVFQSGTNDILSTMLIRSRPLCARYEARALLPIHDELLFEAKLETADAFVAEMRALLERQPSPEWVIPIRVDAKVGQLFGEMRAVK